MRKTMIAAVSTLALMTGAAFAQSTTGTTAGGSTGSGGTTTNSPTMQRTDNTAGTSATGANSATLASAEKLLGKNVYGKDNEKVGEVDDIILDPASGQAKQLVLSSGGFLGIGDKKIAVDFSQAKWNEADNRLQLSTLGRDDVKNMAEFKYDDRMTSLNRNRDASKNDASTAPANQRATTGTTNPATPPSGTSQPKQ
ncbi:MAG TPA: PRC-barrel domain-containing protein [Azospirillum sp.]|nr:PRC-barrel domain-containing protein [Azospirillum sp.]